MWVGLQGCARDGGGWGGGEKDLTHLVMDGIERINRLAMSDIISCPAGAAVRDDKYIYFRTRVGAREALNSTRRVDTVFHTFYHACFTYNN